MLINKKVCSIIIICLLCLGFLSCSKQVQNSETPNINQTLERNSERISTADNSLILYIPEDSAIFFASNRTFDSNSQGLKHWIKKAGAYFENAQEHLQNIVTTRQEKYTEEVKAYLECTSICEERSKNRQKIEQDLQFAIDRGEHEDMACGCPSDPRLYSNDLELSLDLLKPALAETQRWKELFNDFNNQAVEWGLEVQGHMDVAFFMSNQLPILKFTVKNSDQFQKKLEAPWTSVRELIETYPCLKEGADTCPETVLDVLNDLPASAYTILDINGERWVYYSPEIFELEHIQHLFPLLAHYDHGIVTLAWLPSEIDTDLFLTTDDIPQNIKQALAAAIKPATKPISIDSLNIKSEQTLFAGKVQKKGLFNLISQSKGIEDFLNEGFAEAVTVASLDKTERQDRPQRVDSPTELLASFGKSGAFSTECKSLYRNLFEKYSDLQLQLDLDSSGKLDLQMNLRMPPERVAKLKSLQSPISQLPKVPLGIGLRMGIKLMDLGGHLVQIKDSWKERAAESKCEAVSYFAEDTLELFFDFVKRLSPSPHILDMDKVMTNVHSISFDILLDSYETSLKPKWSALFVGSNLLDTFTIVPPKYYNALHHNIQALGSILSIYLDSERFALATSPFDVAEVHQTQLVPSNTFLEAYWNMWKTDLKTNLTIETNDQGLSIRVVAQ